MYATTALLFKLTTELYQYSSRSTTAPLHAALSTYTPLNISNPAHLTKHNRQQAVDAFPSDLQLLRTLDQTPP